MSLINTVLKELSARDRYRAGRETDPKEDVFSGLVPALSFSPYPEQVKNFFHDHPVWIRLVLFTFVLAGIQSIWSPISSFKMQKKTLLVKQKIELQVIPVWQVPWKDSFLLYPNESLVPLKMDLSAPWAIDLYGHDVQTFPHMLNANEVVDRIKNFESTYRFETDQRDGSIEKKITHKTEPKIEPFTTDWIELPALPIPPTWVEPKTETKKFLKKKSRSKSKSIDLIAGEEALAQKEYAEARSLFQIFLEDFPNHVGAREGLVAAWIGFGDLEHAKVALDEGLKMNPEYPPFWRLKGLLLLKKGNPKLALSYLKGHQPRIEQYPDYYALMASIYQQLGAYELAGSYYEDVLAINPEKGVWWLGLAIALESVGKESEAFMAYAKAQTRGLSQMASDYAEKRMAGLNHQTG